VDTAIGPIVAVGEHQIGAKVVVATRPEHVRYRCGRLGGRASAASIAAEGRVRQVIFHGFSAPRIAVDLGDEADFSGRGRRRVPDSPRSARRLA